MAGKPLKPDWTQLAKPSPDGQRGYVVVPPPPRPAPRDPAPPGSRPADVKKKK